MLGITDKIGPDSLSRFEIYWSQKTNSIFVTIFYYTGKKRRKKHLSGFLSRIKTNFRSLNFSETFQK